MGRSVTLAPPRGAAPQHREACRSGHPVEEKCRRAGWYFSSLVVAGAMSMAAGEYVSVSSQSDTEQADLARERKELSENPAFELD